MAWIYSQESGEWRLALPHGFAQSPTVKSIPTAKASFCLECMNYEYRSQEYGTTCVHCGKKNLAHLLWTLSTVDSLARTSVKQALELAWRESEADLYSSSSGWLANADQVLHSWKTYQISLFGDSDEFSWSCMHWGMAVDGLLCRPAKLAESICDDEHSHLPTPTATDHKRGFAGTQGGYLCLPALAARGMIMGHPKGLYNPKWTEQAMGYPKDWTELKPWAMQWFRSRRGKRLKD